MILYLGNMLSRHGGSVSVIDTLAPRIAQNFPVKAYSSLRSPVLRLMEMLIAIVANARSTKIVLIDAYSSPRAFLYLWAASQLCRLLHIPYGCWFSVSDGLLIEDEVMFGLLCHSHV